MKKNLPILAIIFFVVACNNEGAGDGSKDTMESSSNTINRDTSMHDTASYDRMPQKNADSIPH
jgi:hypothetical protein